MSLGVCLKRSCFSLLVAGLLLVSSNISGAQVLSGMPGLGNFDLGSVRVVPFVQAGYKNIGLSLNLPFTVTPVQGGSPFYAPPSLDLRFQDSGVWVGSVGLDARLLPAVFFTIRADANARKNINIFAGENFPWYGQPNPFSWSGSQLQWWDLDGMAGYVFYKNWSATVGLRYDYLTVGLGNAVDATGTPLDFAVPGFYDQVSGNIIVKTWIPYIGLQLSERNYKALLIYSPLASPSVITPQTVLEMQSAPYVPYVDNVTFEWDFAKTGSFLEFSFEYNLAVLKELNLGLWAKGTWIKSIGSGSWEMSEYASPPSPPPANSLDSASGTLSTYGLSVGIAASLFF
jgi:hypothetical protein